MAPSAPLQWSDAAIVQFPGGPMASRLSPERLSQKAALTLPDLQTSVRQRFSAATCNTRSASSSMLSPLQTGQGTSMDCLVETTA